MAEIALRACQRTFAVQCDDDRAAAHLEAVFGRLIVSPSTLPPAIRRYRIDACAPGSTYRFSDGDTAVSLADLDRLLFHLDKEITLALQHERPDLFFLHAAAVAWNGAVAVLSAAPGTGKSTLTLATLDLGLEYLSDELAPVDLRRLTVDPYPRALCLKSPPPPPYSLPADTLVHDRRFHVPVAAFAGPPRDAWPLAALIFLRRDDERFAGPRPITPGSAVARLMANALNPLAHDGDGLDAAVALGQAVPAFELDVSDTRAASAAVKAILESSPAR